MRCGTAYARKRFVIPATVLALVAVFALVGLQTDTPATRDASPEFYVLIPGNEARSYIEPLHVGVPTEFIIGVANYENREVTYRVEARLATPPSGLHMSTSGPGTEAQDERSFIIRDLPHGSVWEHPVTLTALEPRDFQRLDLMLFSPLPRDGHILQTSFLGCATAEIELRESEGLAIIAVVGGNIKAHEFRIEAWQNGHKVAELPMRIEVAEVRTWEFRYPVGETRFKLYDGDTVVMDDTGAEHVLQFRLDIVE